MSADGDTVRKAMHFTPCPPDLREPWDGPTEEEALAALARLEAADDAAEALANAAAEYEAQRDALAEALREAADNAESWHGIESEGTGAAKALAVIASRARAALAEAGLE